MANTETAKQFSFRLSDRLIERVERCMGEFHAAGLGVTRAETVRLLLQHALDTTHGKVDLLLAKSGTKAPKRPRRKP